MGNTNPKMDVYSDHQVPFDVAAFCRGRRYMPEVVRLGNALRVKEDAKAALEAAERRVLVRESEVEIACKALSDKMQEMGER